MTNEIATRTTATLAIDMTDCTNLGKMYYRGGYVPRAWTDELGAEGAQYRVMGLVFEAAQRGISPLLMLQNVDFINGRMSWKSAFVIELIQQAGWHSIVYEWTGEPNSKDFWADDENGCTFTAINPVTKQRERGTKITVGMVKAEGWLGRKGSKWQTMPEQMFKFRAAAFFGRTNCPAVMGGSMYSNDELADIPSEPQVAQVIERPQPALKAPESPEESELPDDIKEFLMAEYAAKMGKIAADKDLSDDEREEAKRKCEAAIEKETSLAKKDKSKYRDRIANVRKKRLAEFNAIKDELPRICHNHLTNMLMHEGESQKYLECLAMARQGDTSFLPESDSSCGMEAASGSEYHD